MVIYLNMLQLGIPLNRGSVNLGGLFVLEPFISPALYQKYPGAVDEWTLTQLMAADTAGGGVNQLEDHYNTFIVRFGFPTVSDLIRLCYPDY